LTISRFTASEGGPVRKVLFVVALASVATAFVAGPAGAQQTYPEVGGITLSDASIDCASDDELTITGQDFIPNEPAVRIFFDGDQVASVFPNSQGAFSVTLNPPGAAAGQHTIEARQFVSAEEDDEIVATATVTCVGAAVAFTGANISMWVILLAALVLIGGAALLADRRRARQAS
jgi:hypothetical protein